MRKSKYLFRNLSLELNISYRLKENSKELSDSSSLPFYYRINMRIAKTLSMISSIYKKRFEIKKAIRFESEAYKSFFKGYLPGENIENTFTADFLMQTTSY